MPDDHVGVEDVLTRFQHWCSLMHGYEAQIVESPHAAGEQSVLVHVVTEQGSSYRLFLSRCKLQIEGSEVQGLQLAAFVPVESEAHIPSLCLRCSMMQYFSGGGDVFNVLREKDGSFSIGWTAKYSKVFEPMLLAHPERALEEAYTYVRAMRCALLAASRYDGTPHWTGDVGHA